MSFAPPRPRTKQGYLDRGLAGYLAGALAGAFPFSPMPGGGMMVPPGGTGFFNSVGLEEFPPHPIAAEPNKRLSTKRQTAPNRTRPPPF